MFYTIDRFEGEYAVLEDDSENRIIIKKALLPKEAGESDVLEFDGESYVVNAEETEKRRQAVTELLRRMGL